MIKQDLSVWSDLDARPADEVLAFIADEVWRRTEGPFFLAERAKLELAVCRATTLDDKQRAVNDLVALHESELAESRHQAALVSQALGETAAEGYEAWCRAAMARLNLAPLSQIEADECLKTARRVREEMHRPMGAVPSDDGAAPVRTAA